MMKTTALITIICNLISITNATLYTDYETKNGKKYKLGYGCHNNYCWSYCGSNWEGGEWCYTRAKRNDPYLDIYGRYYESCFTDSDCSDKLDECYGNCTL
eukprot:TCONS_00013587-protein